MSKNRDSITYGGFFELDYDSPLDEALSKDKRSILDGAQSIIFELKFAGVKSEYKLRDIRIYIEGNVLFDLQTYSFAGKSYLYGTYPTEKEISAFIKGAKDDALEQLNKAAVEG